MHACALHTCTYTHAQMHTHTLNVPTLKEAPCCYKGVAVHDLGLGQVHLMTC